MDKYLISFAGVQAQKEHVKNIPDFLEDGNTILFIARYRKELTGFRMTRHCGLSLSGTHISSV